MRKSKDRRIVRLSKYLSKYLRHRPEELGLALMPGGWVEVDALLAASAHRGFSISRDELEAVVARNDKKRFAFDESGALIRAQQGHSAPVDLELERATPPARLYHGSPDEAMARAVGARRGRSVVLVVDAEKMHRDGYVFCRSGNGVWLVKHVP